MPPKSKRLISNYALTGPGAETILTNALNLLRPHLPSSIPLYRRLQRGRFLDATRLLTNLTLDSNGASAPSDPTSHEAPWVIAFVDRSCRPETEVWFFGSWESAHTSSTEIEEQQEAIDRVLRHVLLATKGLEVPHSIHQDVLDAQIAALQKTSDEDEERDHGGLSRKDYAGHAADPDIMLWGAIHERTVAAIQRLNVLTFRFKASLVANSTFIFPVDSLADPKPLPKGLRWGVLETRHFELVRARTSIPRQDRTLSLLPNLGIFPDGDGMADAPPISWAFVGLDASLTTLHVEPEWRGRGLAKAITTKLFREKMGLFWEDGVERLAHGYVIVGNEESERVCRSLGAKSEWDVYWLRIDLRLV